MTITTTEATTTKATTTMATMTPVVNSEEGAVALAGRRGSRAYVGDTSSTASIKGGFGKVTWLLVRLARSLPKDVFAANALAAWPLSGVPSTIVTASLNGEVWDAKVRLTRFTVIPAAAAIAAAIFGKLLVIVV
jgi:hypothetical protein